MELKRTFKKREEQKGISKIVHKCRSKNVYKTRDREMFIEWDLIQ